MTLWQLNALAEALWAYEQGYRPFEHLEPSLPLEKSGDRRPVGVEVKRPGYLSVRVPRLDELGLVEHWLYLMSLDYPEAVRSLSAREREAYDDYVSKPRLSSPYWVRKVRRRLSSGERKSYLYLDPADLTTPQLESALKKLLSACSLPDLGRVMAEPQWQTA